MDLIWWLATGTVGSVLFFILVWSDYLAVMHMRTMKKQGKFDNLVWKVKACAYIRLAIFAVEDVVFNFIWGTIRFLELPREWLFTTRVSRLNDRDDWRGDKARYYCKNYLNPFDIDGRHCK